jgi:flavodoxin
MKAVIVYDSVYGNTEKIARAMAEAIAPDCEVKVLRASEADVSELSSADLVIAGCPTHGGRPTPAMQEFLSKVPESSLQGITAAAFDTRVPAKWVKILGFAAGKIADSLKKKGATLMASPEGFFVKGKEGPLKAGELERAAGWARGIIETRK